MIKLGPALAEVVTGLGNPAVLVVGDVMLDVYAIGSVTRISQEAPIPILTWEDHEYRAGGAANVAVMLAALGARARLAGVVGDDEEGRTLRQILEDAGVNLDALLVDRGRCTTAKHRFVGRAPQRQPHQLLRMDREIARPLPPELSDHLFERLASAERPDSMVISDYGKGVCQGDIAKKLIMLGRDWGIPVLVDPAPAGDFEQYSRASVITPNRHEVQRATGQTISCPNQALAAGQVLCRRLRLDAAVITLDRDGIALAYPHGPARVFPTRAREVCDVTGAGDMVLAMLALCRATGISWELAIELANTSAGLEVERFGATPISRQELFHEVSGAQSSSVKVVSRDQLVEQVALRRQQGQRIIFTNGCYDLLHPGHLCSLEQGAQLGDCLVVGVNGDDSARQLKGPGRPVLSQGDRAAMLAALACVDYVTVFQEADPRVLLDLLRPDVLFKGGDYPPEGVVGKDIVESYGGRVYIMPVTVDASSTGLIQHIRGLAVAG